MKKKLVTFLCVIACTLSLAACGNIEYTEVEQSKLTSCENLSYDLIQVAMTYGTEDTLSQFTTNYKKHETEYIFESLTYNNIGYAVESDLGVFEGMLTTYIQASTDMGGIVSIGDCTSTIAGRDIVVVYDLVGNEANGTFKFVYENDMFGKLTAAEAVADLTFKQNMAKAGKNMGKAGLNTLLGMGTVFSVLILISLIISSFNLFKKKPKPVEASNNNTEAQNPVAAVEEELADDTELVAVIMAAINAYEEANGTSTDGFVVRSIRRANRRN